MYDKLKKRACGEVKDKRPVAQMMLATIKKMGSNLYGLLLKSPIQKYLKI